MKMVRLTPPAELTMAAGEAMFSQRAIRRLDRDRPISDEQLKIVLDAASKAPSGGNAQVARFLVIRDRQRIAAFGELYFEAWWAKRHDEYGWAPGHDIPADSPYRMASLMASELRHAPVVILAYALGGADASSVFPGVQNLLLAARALGIGSVLTTLHPRVHGAGQRHVRRAAGRRFPLLYSTRLSPRKFRTDPALRDGGHNLLGPLGSAAALGGLTDSVLLWPATPLHLVNP